jgi:hypothetical protein
MGIVNKINLHDTSHSHRLVCAREWTERSWGDSFRGSYRWLDRAENWRVGDILVALVPDMRPGPSGVPGSGPAGPIRPMPGWTLIEGTGEQLAYHVRSEGDTTYPHEVLVAARGLSVTAEDLARERERAAHAGSHWTDNGDGYLIPDEAPDVSAAEVIRAQAQSAQRLAALNGGNDENPGDDQGVTLLSAFDRLFITESAAEQTKLTDSGAREVKPSGFMREPRDPSKPNYVPILTARGLGIVPAELIQRIAEHYYQGGLKYEPDNWKRGTDPESLERNRVSAAGHFADWLNGKTDEDHAIAALWNMITYEINRRPSQGSTAGD